MNSDFIYYDNDNYSNYNNYNYNYNYNNNFPSYNYNNNRQVISKYNSALEAALLGSRDPISTDSNEYVSVNGQNGLLLNSSEINSWSGPISIDNYKINDDLDADVIRKRPSECVNYLQDINIRYLRPPTPPPPGDIVINEEPNRVMPAAPPIIIRQLPPRSITPPPLVIREAPPCPPAYIPSVHVNIPGRVIDPPARKLVIERLPEIPPKPQKITIERWLPYEKVQRRVVFRASNQPDPIVVNPKNLIIQWESPCVNIEKRINLEGVIRADPNEYLARYGASLIPTNNLPDLARYAPRLYGLEFAANTSSSNNYVHELYGDVAALNLIDLDRYGLGQYKFRVNRYY